MATPAQIDAAMTALRSARLKLAQDKAAHTQAVVVRDAAINRVAELGADVIADQAVVTADTAILVALLLEPEI